ncbi:MAG: CerR family C-terminal domain-containing protein [Candidatus Tectomicrobia bacterium]|uniref:CerR family C-terminal domain-containing protein n=1 Tax=Tectimicrobiota bacterium TaxID=2528274 RepID=A0A932HYT6_UNCTE|nr:CerR family C-terminal domain-containing protein [Candidatus Tectomicrobia bacterium]
MREEILSPEQQFETKQRLIEAAGEIFAETGFHKATVRKICARARTNGAAVNYHFGGKESLYTAVLEYAYQCSHQKFPHDIGLEGDATPAQRLRAFVRSYLLRIFDEGRPAWHSKLLASEMSQPTAALDDLIAKFVRPRTAKLLELVGEILGEPANSEQVRLSARSIIGQCLFYYNCRPIISRLFPEQDYSPADIERLADHITRFSLGALQGVGKSCVAARN